MIQMSLIEFLVEDKDERVLQILKMKERLFYHQELHPDFTFDISEKNGTDDVINIKTIRMNEAVN